VEDGSPLLEGPIFPVAEPPKKKIRGVARPPCCADMPKTQWHRHWQYHCINNPNKETARPCPQCGKVLSSARGDNFERHVLERCPRRAELASLYVPLFS